VKLAGETLTFRLSKTSCQTFLDLSSNGGNSYGGNSYEAKKYSNFGSGDLGKGGPALSDGFTFGSTDDLWGRRWYPSDFANSNFRVRISHGVESSGGPSPGAQDYYNFNLPDLSGKKIRGIEVKVQGLCDGTSSESILKVDSIKLNVYLYHETYDKSIITGSHNGKKYIQYRALFSTNDKSKVPFLDDVKITYSGKFNSKPIVSAKDKEVVLEIGAGSGFFSGILSDMVTQLIVSDPSNEQLEEVKSLKKKNIKLVEAGADTLKLEKETADAIWSFGAMHHCFNKTKAFQNKYEKISCHFYFITSSRLSKTNRS